MLEGALESDDAIQWLTSGGPVGYADALAFMEARVADIRGGRAPETVWLLEHPSLYTAGSSARADELLDSARFPVHRTGRGGRYTYHGPGQRIAYVMLDLGRRGNDVRGFVSGLERWIVAALARFGVRGERRSDRVGIWVARPGAGAREDKIAAIGVRVRRWVTYHGVALNVAPALDHFSGIVPCGVRGHGVTSLADLGVAAAMDDVDAALRSAFEPIFATPIGAADAFAPQDISGRAR